MSEYSPNLPPECLPLPEIQSPIEIFRLGGPGKVADNRAKLSHFERGMKCNPKDCRSHGLSIWLEEDAVDFAVSVFHNFMDGKSIFKCIVNNNDGAIKHTPTNSQDEHYTFWMKNSSNFKHKLAHFKTAEAS